MTSSPSASGFRWIRTNGPRNTIHLDTCRLAIVADKRSGLPGIWWEEGMTPAEARRWLEHLYTGLLAYIDEVSQPQPPREKPLSHYRPTPSIYADPKTYDRD